VKKPPERCRHNARCRYTHGFFCEDCCTFFGKDSPTYRSDELLSTLWCVMHNINTESLRGGGGEVVEALAMRDRIGIGRKHADYESLVSEAEALMAKYGVTADSATVTLS